MPLATTQRYKYVTMDGYLDPTERRNFIISGNLVTEFNTGSVGHTVLLGAENMDTENENFRLQYILLNNRQDDNEDFQCTQDQWTFRSMRQEMQAL